MERHLANINIVITCSAVAKHCVKAHYAKSMDGESQNSSPVKSEPLNFHPKNGVCDYVLGIYPCAKFGCIIISGGFSPHM